MSVAIISKTKTKTKTDTNTKTTTKTMAIFPHLELDVIMRRSMSIRRKYCKWVKMRMKMRRVFQIPFVINLCQTCLTCLARWQILFNLPERVFSDKWNGVGVARRGLLSWFFWRIAKLFVFQALYLLSFILILLKNCKTIRIMIKDKDKYKEAFYLDSFEKLQNSSYSKHITTATPSFSFFFSIKPHETL